MCFRRCSLADFHVSPDQVVLLLLFSLSLEILSGLVIALPAPQFNSYAFPIYGFSLACFFFAAFLIGKIIGKKDAVLELAVITFSASPVFSIFYIAAHIDAVQAWNFPLLWYGLGILCFILLAALLTRPLRLVALPKFRFSALGLIVFSLVWLAPSTYFGDDVEFWYSASPEWDENDLYADYRDLDAEGLLYGQHDLLQSTLTELRPDRPGITDLFFVSFAGYAHQDVFSKEVDYTQRLLDERFGTAGRSVKLINHLETRNEIPLATSTNLATALKHIGQAMNPEEDILVLYLTSHGSEDHELAVSFWPLALNDITPGMLKQMLDSAGIKWRVIIISACYSGGFVEQLKSPHTVVATAAAADRQSFGCGNDNDFTYFGEAVFKDQLNREFSLIKAFRQAAVSIAEREMTERLKPSRPQLFVGETIEDKLRGLTVELIDRVCRGNLDEDPACAELHASPLAQTSSLE